MRQHIKYFQGDPGAKRVFRKALREVSNSTGFKQKVLKTKPATSSRTEQEARHILMLALKRLGLSYPAIAECMGYGHPGIHYGVKAIEAKIAKGDTALDHEVCRTVNAAA